MPPYTSGITQGAASIWSIWMDNGTAMTSQTVTYSSNQVWNNWCQATAATSAQITYNSSPGPPPAPLTPEQVEATRLHVERINKQAEEYRKKQAVTRAKARQLLEEVLNEEQRYELAKSGFFHVHTAKGKRTYRLAPGHSPRLVKSEDGKMYSYCIHTREGFPVDDALAAFKLLLDADEKEFLKIANASFIGNSPMPAPSAVPRVRRREAVAA